MIEELSNLSPEQLFEYCKEELQYRSLEDHIFAKDFRPETKQKLFYETGLHAKERGLFGANRSGKSLCVGREVSFHITGYYPKDSFDYDGMPWDWNGYVYTKPVNVWVSGVTNVSTFQTLKKYYFGSIETEGFIHSSLIVDKDTQKHIYYIRHSSGGISTVRFMSYIQGEDAWQAETCDIIHLDEEPPSKIYSEAITRTASTSPDHHGMVLLSMTPLKNMTSLMLKYMQNVIMDEHGEEKETVNVGPEEVINSRTYIIISHDDASHMGEEEKKRLYNSYDAYERQARTTGIPSIGSGLIYPILEDELLVSPFEIPEYWPRCFGMDFGWHNTAAVFMAHDQDNDVVYLYAEYLAGHLTPQHHSLHLIKQGADWMPGGYDHAGEGAQQDYGGNIVDLYQESGIRNWTPADKRSVNKGIYTVLQRMETGRLKIFTTLKKLMTELRMYARDDNGKVKKGNDHLMDAMRYGVVTGLPLARVKPSVINKYRIPVNTGSGSSNGSWMIV